ncbi:phytoene/squalene synthase family protein [Pseudalkalibacillus caeni]|uniref:Squalene/phytoene synthase family protein n=1 Tax=Exobacillus caeni TaxID=2574798 RepID=A0A5R9F3G3_9BACL|nr:phytoene/squalene synthase family protein [Pseudalkalibacillus caeni]TLS37571.1 squalene/phytoene synthase family protein [Pseudalkalibacillus caeni]
MILKAYEHCENIIKKNSKTFYRAFSFLPESKKRAVWAVYAFCREVDDIVDEGNEPAIQLAEFEEDFEAFLTNRINADNLMWVALEDVFEQFKMDINPFRDMIIGQKMDLYKTKYASLAELEDYSYHVASTVGLMLLPILAPENKGELREGAVSLGIAMQITNVLRDIGEDLERGRIYLPEELLKKHKYLLENLLAKKVTAEFIAIWEELATIADCYYEEAFKTISLYPEDARLPVQSAAVFYRAILDSVRRNEYQVFHKRSVVSDEEKKDLLMKFA